MDGLEDQWNVWDSAVEQETRPTLKMLHITFNGTNFVNFAGLLNRECILPLRHSTLLIETSASRDGTIFDA